ncbi:MAG TPA: hypothetical protein PK765_02960 [bacterium]|nr:hypothetical protein [bacterium]
MISTPAFASIEVSPLKFELSADPGTSLTRTIRLRNTGTGAETLYTSVEDFFASDDSGRPTFIPTDRQVSDAYSLARWINIPDKNLTLSPGETREVVIRIDVPSNAEPGGHYGAALFASDQPVQETVAAVARLGVLVLVEVSGEIRVSGEPTSYNVGFAGADGTLTYPDVFEQFPISFETAFSNSGNTHLSPTGRIEIVDENGQKLTGIGKQTVMNQAGAFIRDEIVDYLPINDVGGDVLPGTTRKFKSPWEGFAYQVLNDNGTKSVFFRTPADYYAEKAEDQKKFLQFWESVKTRTVTKDLTANFFLSYAGKDQQVREFRESKAFSIRYEERYVDYNYFVIAGFALVLVLILVYILYWAPRSRERMRREIMREMARSNDR